MAAALYFAGAGAHYHSCAPVLSSCPLLAPLLFLFEPPWPSRAEPMLLVILKHYPSPSIPISLVVPVFSHLVYLILQPQFPCAPVLQAQLFGGKSPSQCRTYLHIHSRRQSASSVTVASAFHQTGVKSGVFCAHVCFWDESKSLSPTSMGPVLL